MRAGERGVELFEFALLLPFLVVLVAGVADFAQAWNARQILANAAREGARVGSNGEYNDLSTTDPASIQKVCQDVANYLIQANLSPSFMGVNGTTASAVTSTCSSPGTVLDSTTGATVAYTYYSTGSYGLKITPLYQITTSGAECPPLASTCTIFATKVSLTYPYNWSFGFNNAINMISSSSYTPTITIKVYSTMNNLNN
jgi:Flp pilus assembly protein TadG